MKFLQTDNVKIKIEEHLAENYFFITKDYFAQKRPLLYFFYKAKLEFIQFR